MTSGGSNRVLFLALALALTTFAKAVLILTTHGTMDAAMWDSSARQIRLSGGESVYAGGVAVYREGQLRYREVFNHPPFMVHFLDAAGKLEEATGIPPSTLVRILDTAADVGTVLLVACMAAPGNYAALLITILAPVQILISGFHSNTDPLFSFFTVAAIYLLQARSAPGASGAVFGAAVCIKIVPSILLPVMLLYIDGWRRRIHFAAASSLVWCVASLPYLLAIPGLVVSNVFGYKSRTGTWGLSLAAPRVLPESLAGAFNSYGHIVPLAAVVLVTLILHARNRDLTLFQRCGILYFTFLLLSPGFGMQYLSWLTPWLASIAWPAGLLHALAAGAFAALQYIVWTPGRVHDLLERLTRQHGPAAVDAANAACWLSILAVLASIAAQLRRAKSTAKLSRDTWQPTKGSPRSMSRTGS